MGRGEFLTAIPVLELKGVYPGFLFVREAYKRLTGLRVTKSEEE
jgi:hypothetical protein